MFGWLHRKCKRQKDMDLKAMQKTISDNYILGRQEGYEQAKRKISVEGHHFYRTALQGLMQESEHA